MNTVWAWLIGIAASVLSGILIQFFYIPFRVAQAVGKYEEKIAEIERDKKAMEEDIGRLRKSTFNRIDELRERFDNFRVKVAAKTGINGGD